ncbi:MAG TPA: TIM-barrel domain-containing protein [Cytophagaceae bacterium]|nr:TIM-barrel domain-containing protein [Cytophagaceae bacterium]
MKRNYLSLIAAVAFTAAQSFAQTSVMVGDRIAMFYPPNFEAARHLPSLALLNEPTVQGNVPNKWQVRPEFELADGKSIVQITLKEPVDFYGTGEVVGPLRRNGQTVQLWNTDNYCYKKNEGKSLYQSHPWVMGVRDDGTAFGIIADNTWKQTIQTEDQSILITSDGPAFRVLIIERENPKELVKALADLTGKMELPPLWALGFQQCRYSYYPDTRVKEIADKFREKKIPADVIWMDIDYMHGYRIFTFDENGFPDPKGLNQYLKDKQFKSVYMIDPGVKVDENYDIYKQGSAGNHWVQTKKGKEFNGVVWPGQCAFPDFTRPETQKWWASLYTPFMNLGIDGIWNDMNEPAVFNTDEGTMPEDNLHRGGGELPQDSHMRYHNVYGMLMVRSSREGILAVNPTLRPFVLSRANFLGGQRYAATWTGDNVSTWNHLKLSIPMSLSLGLSGQPFSGSDIGGFAGFCNAELLAQWMSIGAYYPFSRNHAEKSSDQQEPWALGKKAESASRTALNRRYKLMPFLYTLFEEASTTGAPVMRPVFMCDSKDKNLRNEQEAFTWGDDLLIIPSWAENTAIPKGNWKNLKLDDTPETDPYQAKLKIREGSIIPTGPVIQSTMEYSIDSLTLYVNLDQQKHAMGKLYHDDGNGFGYKKGDYALYEFKASSGKDNSIVVSVDQVKGNKKIKSVYRVAIVQENKTSYSDWVGTANITVHLE